MVQRVSSVKLSQLEESRLSVSHSGTVTYTKVDGTNIVDFVGFSVYAALMYGVSGIPNCIACFLYITSYNTR